MQAYSFSVMQHIITYTNNHIKHIQLYSNHQTHSPQTHTHTDVSWKSLPKIKWNTNKYTIHLIEVDLGELR